MARAAMLLLLSTLSVLVTSSFAAEQKQYTVQYSRYFIQFYETIPESDTVAFRPLSTEKVQHKGIGYIKHNNVLHTSNGYQVGSVGGLYFYHSTDTIEDVVTITFSDDFKELLSGSSISLRGLWVMSPDGNTDAKNQELAIVGGQGRLSGATGSVIYRRVEERPKTRFLITCDIYVPSRWSEIPQTVLNLEDEFKSLDDAVKVQPEFLDFTETIPSLDFTEQVVESSR